MVKRLNAVGLGKGLWTLVTPIKPTRIGVGIYKTNWPNLKERYVGNRETPVVSKLQDVMQKSLYLGYSHGYTLSIELCLYIEYSHTLAMVMQWVWSYIEYVHTLGMVMQWLWSYIGHSLKMSMVIHWVCSYIEYGIHWVWTCIGYCHRYTEYDHRLSMIIHWVWTYIEYGHTLPTLMVLVLTWFLLPHHRGCTPLKLKLKGAANFKVLCPPLAPVLWSAETMNEFVKL